MSAMHGNPSLRNPCEPWARNENATFRPSLEDHTPRQLDGDNWGAVTGGGACHSLPSPPAATSRFRLACERTRLCARTRLRVLIERAKASTSWCSLAALLKEKLG